MNVKTSEESIVLIFINRGRARLENCLLKPCKFCQNSFNLYYLTGEIDFVLDLKRGNENKYFGLAISKKFYTNLGNKHSALFEPINRKISLKSSFSLFNKGIFISYEIDQIIRQIQDCELKGKATSLFMEAKIQELFAILLSARNNQQVGEISQYVRDKLYEARFIIERKYRRPLRIHDLAIQVGTNDTTLKAGFKKLFNRTVFGYLSDYRMNKAKKLLRTEKSLSISDIALKIGYESHSNFTTAFKRKIGITPKKFRQ